MTVANKPDSGYQTWQWLTNLTVATKHGSGHVSKSLSRLALKNNWPGLLGRPSLKWAPGNVQESNNGQRDIDQITVNKIKAYLILNKNYALSMSDAVRGRSGIWSRCLHMRDMVNAHGKVHKVNKQLTLSLIFSQMILVISSPSSSTTGLATLILLPPLESVQLMK